MLSRWEAIMWLNFIFLVLACLCVGFILGWVVARPRRWGVFVANAPQPSVPRTDAPQEGGDQTDADSFARRA
ncbi:hypothetical protein Airi02_005970 [Actinoallomurus iriomotensis]|uniref:Uncharacterized protein n=2 Tax=Actinoallomurus iriomotensis TaxID=478107 RepID=A0A9W6RVN3_9ACTN|nr:hypothetical protein Airi02_005970 [Actinoallomurus iriomotensis]